MSDPFTKVCVNLFSSFCKIHLTTNKKKRGVNITSLVEVKRAIEIEEIDVAVQVV